MRKPRDSDFVFFICEAKFLNVDDFIPVPEYGCASLKGDAKKQALKYFRKRRIDWAMNKEWSNTSRAIRFKKYRLSVL